jgi:hypothetical protein
MCTQRFVKGLLISAVLTVGATAGFSGLLYTAANAEPSTTQEPTKWEGACARCGEGYTWFGSSRPIQNRCTRFNNGQPCNGAVMWQPIF